MSCEAEEKRRKKEALAEKILTQARNELYLEMPFLDCALGEGRFEKREKIRGIGTDAETVFYQDDQIFAWYQESRTKVKLAYLHMILHGIFLHWQSVQTKDPFLWNTACDFAAEYVIDQLKIKKTQDPDWEERQRWYGLFFQRQQNMTAEKAQTWMREQCTQKQAQRLSVLFTRDDHTFWYRDKERAEEEKEDSKERAGRDGGRTAKEEAGAQRAKERWRQISQKTLLNLELFAKEGGANTGNLRRQISYANRKQYDYGSFLRKFMTVKEERKVDIDSFDYGLYRYGLERYGSIPIIEPLEYKEEKKLEEFVIALDTSASCSRGLIEQFLAETMAILEQGNFFKRICLHLIQCDNEIQEDVCVTGAEEFQNYRNHFEAKGLGGTDFCPVFSYIDSLREKKQLRNLKGMIYFTDGYGRFPKKKPDYEAAFVFLQEEPKDVKVPVWAVKILLETETLRRKME